MKMPVHVIFRSNEKRPIFLEKTTDLRELRIQLAYSLISPDTGNESGLADLQVCVLLLVFPEVSS